MRTVRRDDDEHDVVADGESVRGPLMLKDGWPNRSGFVSVNSPAVRDAQRMARDARQAWLRDLTSAWKRGAVSRDAGSEPDASERPMRGRTEPDADDAARRRRDALRARDEQLVNAWKTLGRSDPREADRIERQRRGWTAEDCP